MSDASRAPRRFRPELPGDLLTTLAAVVAVLLTSTAFSGVFADARWIPPSVATTAAVAVAGAVVRSWRWWSPLVVLAQIAAILVTLTGLFSDRAILGVVPGGEAVAELFTLFGTSLDTVRNGVPPVPADTALQCLVCLGIGLIALAVDAIAVTARSPAVAGLVLLCVFAVPASLADTMLPWWSFVAGAAGFVVLLIAEGRHTRPRRQGGSERSPARPGPGLGRNSLAVAGMAVVVALLVGSTFTAVGTRGRLPGSDPSSDATATSGIGLRPFTSLRGQLRRDDPVELFRVRGLPEDAYLRAMTLREFDPNSGWKLAGLTRGVPARGRLPLPRGLTPPVGERARIEIEPVGYRDAWLPVFGVPLKVSGMGRNWRYDPASGIVFTQVRQQTEPYVEIAAFPEPSPAELRSSNGPARIDPAYLEIEGVSRRIIELAERITAGAPTDFDRAVALNRFFTDPSNGFTYDLETAPASSGRALEDFLFRGKRGYCEQFASAMAVLLRAVGIPSRVAVGFTSGHVEDGERVITTRDAHAWVEAYFPGYGWITFDPTPLQDGRTSLPSYLDSALDPEQPNTSEGSGSTPGPAPGSSSEDGGDRGLVPPPPVRPGPGSPDGVWAAVGVSVLVLALLAGPALLRGYRRHRRLRVVSAGGPGAPGTAWRELLDEFRDRGGRPAGSDTARTAGHNLAARYGLDEDGVRAVRSLVELVEREWYAPPGQPADPASREVLRRIVESLHRSAPLGWRSRLFPRSVLRPGGSEES